jgi:hypothetical protein
VLSDEKITVHLRHAGQDVLKEFVEQQLAAMKTSEKLETLSEIPELDTMILYLEINGEIGATTLLNEIISKKIKMVLRPLISALNEQDTTLKDLSAVPLDIARLRLKLHEGA